MPSQSCLLNLVFQLSWIRPLSSFPRRSEYIEGWGREVASSGDQWTTCDIIATSAGSFAECAGRLDKFKLPIDEFN